MFAIVIIDFTVPLGQPVKRRFPVTYGTRSAAQAALRTMPVRAGVFYKIAPLHWGKNAAHAAWTIKGAPAALAQAQFARNRGAGNRVYHVALTAGGAVQLRRVATPSAKWFTPTDAGWYQPVVRG